MKTIYLTGIFCLIICCAHAQSNIDTALTSWIKKHNYVQLTDSANMPKGIGPYYKTVMAAVNQKIKVITDFYITPKWIKNEPDILTISYFYISTLLYEKHFEEQSAINHAAYLKRANDPNYTGNDKNMELVPPMVTGNVSGLDGELRLTKSTGEVHFYMYQ